MYFGHKNIGSMVNRTRKLVAFRVFTRKIDKIEFHLSPANPSKLLNRELYLWQLLFDIFGLVFRSHNFVSFRLGIEISVSNTPIVADNGERTIISPASN